MSFGSPLFDPLFGLFMIYPATHRSHPPLITRLAVLSQREQLGSVLEAYDSVHVVESASFASSRAVSMYANNAITALE